MGRYGIAALQFTSPSTGWATLFGPGVQGMQVFRSDDAGANWTLSLKVDPGYGGPPRMRFDPQGRGIVVLPSNLLDRPPIIERTDDAGANWTPVTVPDGLRVSGNFGLVSATEMWFFASRSVSNLDLIFHTTDAGRSWSAGTSFDPGNGPGWSWQIEWAPGGCAWAESPNGKLMSTIDGGGHWQTLNPTTASGATWSELVSFDGKHGVLLQHVGPSGLNGVAVVVSDDGGQSWSPARSVPGLLLQGAVTPAFELDAKHLWVAYGNALLFSADEGRTWSRSSLGGSDLHATRIGFTSPTQGWAQVYVSSNALPGGANVGGSVFVSSTGGSTWTEAYG